MNRRSKKQQKYKQLNIFYYPNPNLTAEQAQRADIYAGISPNDVVRLSNEIKDGGYSAIEIRYRPWCGLSRGEEAVVFIDKEYIEKILLVDDENE